MGRYVVDSSAMISFFADHLSEASVSMSKEALDILENGFYSDQNIFFFPVCVFIESHFKFCNSPEKSAEFRSAIFEYIANRPNMEIRQLDHEVLTALIEIVDTDDANFDNHDKQILATAMVLEATLLTSDVQILKFNSKHNVVPNIIS